MALGTTNSVETQPPNVSADLCEGGSSPPSTGHRDGTSGSVGPCLPRGTAALAGPLAHSAGRSLPWNLAAASHGAGQSSWPGRGPTVQSSLLAAGSAANNEARQQPLCKAPDAGLCCLRAPQTGDRGSQQNAREAGQPRLEVGTWLLGFLGSGILGPVTGDWTRGWDVGEAGNGVPRREGSESEDARAPRLVPELSKRTSLRSPPAHGAALQPLSSPKSRRRLCTRAGVCVLHEPCFHGK